MLSYWLLDVLRLLLILHLFVVISLLLSGRVVNESRIILLFVVGIGDLRWLGSYKWFLLDLRISKFTIL